jgi:excinuclease UvrABC nuclease subunit
MDINELAGPRWRKFILPDERCNIPQAPGCYVVFGDGKLLYVGQASNVKLRMQSHAVGVYGYSAWITTPWGKYHDVLVKVRRSDKYGDWAMRELRLIRRLKPPFNIRGCEKKVDSLVWGASTAAKSVVVGIET